MVAEQKIQVKQNAVLVVSIGTFLTVVSAVFYIGRQFERAESRLEATVTAVEFHRWERQTERINDGWRGAGIIDLHETTIKSFKEKNNE